MLVKPLPYHSLSLTACTMTTGMMIGAKMETSTATMAPPSQWTGSTMVSKTVPMVKMKRTWADLMMSSCAMMVRLSQWTGSTMVTKTVPVAKMKWTWADLMTSSCAMMEKPSQWTGSTMVKKTVWEAKMKAMFGPLPMTTVLTQMTDSVLLIVGPMKWMSMVMEPLKIPTVTGITNVSNSQMEHGNA